MTQVHGYNNNHDKPHGMHFDTKQAHLKEWVNLVTHTDENLTLHDNADSFSVNDGNSVATHFTMQAHRKDVNGGVEFFFDDLLAGWLTFVAKGCPTPDKEVFG